MTKKESLVVTAMRDARHPSTAIPLCHASCPHALARAFGGEEILCTRPLGHRGQVHAAKGVDGEPMLAWRTTRESKTERS